MKTLLSFLMTISCAALVSAADLYYGSFLFPAGGDTVPVCYQYTAATAATKGEKNSPLVKNEIFRVCIVRDKRGNEVTETTEPAVTIDAAGQLVLGPNAAGAKWLDIQYTPNGETTYVNTDWITVGDAAGAPLNKRYSDGDVTYYGFETLTTEDVGKSDGKAYKVYMYLVAMDTRLGEGTCEGFPMHVKSYAMALCGGTKTQKYVESSSASPRAWYVKTGDELDPYDITVYAPGWKLPWQPAAEITSLAVTQDGVGKVLTGDVLKKYLTPEVTTFAQTIVEGKPSLTLTANAPDVQYYTLYTKAKLSDASWVKFEDFAKTLDNVDGKYYTRFRIDGKSLSIPQVHDEASRFYMLRGE